MKKTILSAILLALLFMGCKEDAGIIYNDGARVQLTQSTDDYSYSFVWSDETTKSQIIRIPVSAIARPADRNRYVKIEQVTEYDVEYSYDAMGNVVDSTVTERPEKAVAGVHYAAFNSAETMPLQVIRAGRVTDSIGIKLLRDTSLLESNFRLRIKLAANEDFDIGESKWLERTIVVADRLEKPSNWNYTTTYYLGDYSKTKHELMIEVYKGKVDNEWVEKANNSSSFAVYWRGKFAEGSRHLQLQSRQHRVW